MKYFLLEPNVAGGIGENAVLDNSLWPPVVRRLHYEFDDWGGDAIVESFPVFIVTEEAKRALIASRFTGIAFDDVEITVSTECALTNPNMKLPAFSWLKVTGAAGRDDFGISPKHRLIVSETALNVLQHLEVPNAEIHAYTAP